MSTTIDRVAIVLAGSHSGLAAEIREGRIAAWLRTQGADARVLRIATPGTASIHRDFEAQGVTVPLEFWAADNPDAKQLAQVSRPLFDRLEAFRPTAIILKGFGYALTRLIAANWHFRCRVVGIIGGLVSGDVRWCDAVLIEDEYQADDAHRLARAGAMIEMLPKRLPWDDIRQLPEVPRDLDIVNVGSMEPRKRQQLLIETFPDLGLKLVGSGPLLNELTAQYADRPNIRFAGHLNHIQTLQTIKSAKLVVHVANFEGYPRVFAEAAACGTPLVTLRETTPVAHAEERGVLLSSEATLREDVLALLADPERRADMGKKALAHAEATTSEAAIFSVISRALAHDSTAAGAPAHNQA